MFILLGCSGFLCACAGLCVVLVLVVGCLLLVFSYLSFYLHLVRNDLFGASELFFICPHGQSWNRMPFYLSLFPFTGGQHTTIMDILFICSLICLFVFLVLCNFIYSPLCAFWVSCHFVTSICVPVQPYMVITYRILVKFVLSFLPNNLHSSTSLMLNS